MNNCAFCNLDPTPDSVSPKLAPKRPTGLLRRAWRGTQWLFPAMLLVFMPKCPMCVTAYVALFTGIGISVSTAQWIQILLLLLCLTSLAYLADRYFFNGRGIRTVLFLPRATFHSTPLLSKEH